jgi:hypothetical protein
VPDDATTGTSNFGPAQRAAGVIAMLVRDRDPRSAYRSLRGLRLRKV